MISCLIQIDQFARDGHQWEKEAEYRMVMADKVREHSALVLLAGNGAMRSVRLGAVAVHVSGLPRALVQR